MFKTLAEAKKAGVETNRMETLLGFEVDEIQSRADLQRAAENLNLVKGEVTKQQSKAAIDKIYAEINKMSVDNLATKQSIEESKARAYKALKEGAFSSLQYKQLETYLEKYYDDEMLSRIMNIKSDTALKQAQVVTEGTKQQLNVAQASDASADAQFKIDTMDVRKELLELKRDISKLNRDEFKALTRERQRALLIEFHNRALQAGVVT